MPRTRSRLKSHLSSLLGFGTLGKVFSFSLAKVLHPERGGNAVLCGTGEMPARHMPSARCGSLKGPAITLPVPQHSSYHCPFLLTMTMSIPLSGSFSTDRAPAKSSSLLALQGVARSSFPFSRRGSQGSERGYDPHLALFQGPSLTCTSLCEYPPGSPDCRHLAP